MKDKCKISLEEMLIIKKIVNTNKILMNPPDKTLS